MTNQVDEITQSGINYISEGLKKLGSLKSLNLNFARFGRQFQKKSSFILDRCRCIDDLGLMNLSEGIKRISSLERVSLNFSWYFLRTEGRVLEFIKGVFQLQMMELQVCVKV